MILRYGFLTAMFIFQGTLPVRCLQPEGCDPSLYSWFREGMLGQVGMFPWLGVIRVQLYEGVNVRIALTGAILIKEKFALTIADDIARIPRRIFERDSKALFIPRDGEPWLYRLKNYTTHPEYSDTKNTLALVELDLENQGPVPLMPICWPTYSQSYNDSSQLYVLGVTDVNDILEKEGYKVRFVKQSECEQWYKRERLISRDDLQRDYLCSTTENSKKQCIYETGMVLASNATGTWTLLGFGVHGPGCLSPARFIDIYKYIPWIEATTITVIKSALRSAPDVPIHRLYDSDQQLEVTEDPRLKITPWIFDRYESGLVPEIVRLDQNAIAIFDSTYEMSKGDCFKSSSLIYFDSYKMYANRLGGKGYYQLSLMDLSVLNFTCVLVRVDAKWKSKAKLWYNYGNFIDPLEGVDETPKQLVKKYLPPEYKTKEPDTTTTQPIRKGRRVISNSRRYKKLISDSIINELQAIKTDLESTRKELNRTGKADISETSKKMFAMKKKLKDVGDKLGTLTPKSLKESINILDNAASELRAGLMFYHGQLMDVRKAEVEKSIDLMKQLRQQPETIDIETASDKPKMKEKKTMKKTKFQGRQGANKPWIPHKLLEPEYITDKPGWWLYHPHLNLEVEYYFEDEAELKIEVWSYLKKVSPTRPGSKSGTRRTRNMTTTTQPAGEPRRPDDNTPKDTPAKSPANGPDESPANGPDKPPANGPDKPPANGPDEPPANGPDKPPANGPDKPPENGPDNPPPPKDGSLRKDDKYKTYSELKRAKYDDHEVIHIRGIDLYDDEETNGSYIVRSERSCVVVVFCVYLCNLF